MNNNARTCSGDSGGPATRYADGYYIAIGDHRGPYYADGSGSFWPCAESGVRIDWPTLYDKTDANAACSSEPPAIANTSPRRYSCRSTARSSAATYSA